MDLLREIRLIAVVGICLAAGFWWARRRGHLESPEAAADGSVVPVLDPETGAVSSMPPRELAPGMIEAQFLEADRRAWVEALQLEPGELRHPPFDDDRRRRIRSIRSALTEVYPLTLEQWEDGFRRDANPDREIGVWQRIARIYERATAFRNWSPGQKLDIFRVIVACSNGPSESVPYTVSLESLSRADAEAVIDLYLAETR